MTETEERELSKKIDSLIKAILNLAVAIERSAIGGAGINEENEELDIVKSLELTAQGSYDEGYRVGRKEGIEAMRETAKCEIVDSVCCSSARMEKIILQKIDNAAEQLKEQKP